MVSTITQPKSTKGKPVIDNKLEFELNDEEQNSRIAVSAYYKAQARGFEPGHELEDWVAAEAEEIQ